MALKWLNNSIHKWSRWGRNILYRGFFYQLGDEAIEKSEGIN